MKPTVEIPFIPDSAPFNAEQRLWLNGFLSGYFTRRTPATPAETAPTNPLEPLLIMFGSQTGSAEGLAKRISKDAAKRGFAPRVFPLNDYVRVELTSAARLLVITSTWGDGEPPDNAIGFWAWLNSENATRLEPLQFAVLGLGDKSYSDFCGASKKFDGRLEALGAHRMVARGECDADYETEASAWLEGFWKAVGNTCSVPAEAYLASPKELDKPPAFGKSNPFPARLLKTAALNKPGSARDVRHYEIGLNESGLQYEAGDALGVLPVNCPDLVHDVIAELRVSPELLVRVADSDMSLSEALTRHLDITRPSTEFLSVVARNAPAMELGALLAPSRAGDLKQWLFGRDVIDLLRLCPEPIDAREFVTLLRKLTPRLYSISSSYKMHPEEVHLTVSTVRYESHGRPRKGVASTFLADRAADSDCVKVFVQASQGFKLPPKNDTPIIMVGPGTGIAPFRAFLEDRQAVGAKGKNWLFFGGQKREADFLYEDQLTGWAQSGHLAKFDLAFSRDQAEKVYVQHRMMENARDLWSWLDAGAHFYVCGDAARMAKDVDATLHAVIEQSGGKSSDEARTYISKMKSEKRYQRDVY